MGRKTSQETREAVHKRIRTKISGSTQRPRLAVYRSVNHIYAQIIDDATGRTLVAASSLDESLHDFKPAVTAPVIQKKTEPTEAPVAAAASAAPAKGKGAKVEKPAAKGGAQPQKGGPPAKGSKPGQAKIVLPTAQKGVAKTPVEALAAIASNRKVAIAREVGKLVGRRAKEKGVTRVVFDRGGYAYHGRVAALAEGAREAGLDF